MWTDFTDFTSPFIKYWYHDFGKDLLNSFYIVEYIKFSDF